MEILEYKIQKGDTLESIAEMHGISVKELVDFHNRNCGATQQILWNKIPIHVTLLFINKKENSNEPIETNYFPDDESTARYRCEQSVMTYIGEIMMNHVDTKREFLVNKYQQDNQAFVKVKLVENIIETYPEQMREAVDLLVDIDLIACNLLSTIDFKSGKIKKIQNHQEILDKWIKHRESIQSKYSYLRNPTTKSDLDRFISTTDEIFNNHDKLVSWVNTKMFFDLFFDKYLVTNKGLTDSFTKTAYSQLFEGLPVKLNFRQDIIGESPDAINLRKVSEMVEGGFDSSTFKKIYNTKFLPLVKYKFSEFRLSYRENTMYDLQNRWITNSDVTIIEEIKNNIRIMISYKIYKIEV